MRRCIVLLLVFAAAASGAAAGGQGELDAAAQAGAEVGLHVFVSIQPQKYFVERIAGEEAKVSVMVPPGKEPHSYEPTPRQVAALSEADVYFRIGVPFEEAFLPRIERSLKELPVVDISAKLQKRHLDARDHGKAEHDREDEEHDPRDEGGLDPHVWLGPLEVKAMAAEIRDTLLTLRPDEAATYRKNYADFAADIDGLHARLADQLAPYEGETMFVFHPSFGYFADTYGLDQEAVETGGSEPAPAQLERIIEEAQEEGVRVIFVQPQFSRDSAERVSRAIDGAVVPINPLAEQWLSNMQTIADRIEEGLRHE